MIVRVENASGVEVWFFQGNVAPRANQREEIISALTAALSGAIETACGHYDGDTIQGRETTPEELQELEE